MLFVFFACRKWFNEMVRMVLQQMNTVTGVGLIVLQCSLRADVSISFASREKQRKWRRLHAG